jgi:hypothetical protein
MISASAFPVLQNAHALADRFPSLEGPESKLTKRSQRRKANEFSARLPT